MSETKGFADDVVDLFGSSNKKVVDTPDPVIPIVIENADVKAVFWRSRFYDVNMKADVPISDALRLSNLYQVRVDYPFTRYDPSHWHSSKRFGLMGNADVVSGFGNCTVNLIKYSEKEQCDVRWIGRGIQVPELAYLQYRTLPLSMAMVWHDQPRDAWVTSPFEKNIAITPFETTRVPSSWVPKLNKMSAVFVPCKQNIQMMKDSGVVVPVELIHWGVDPEKWHKIDRPSDRKLFTFGSMGALSIRKGTDILIDAFVKAFPIHQYPLVRLLLKTSYNVFPFGVKDRRIVVQQTAVDHQQLMDSFVKETDVFVFPSRGEGFGLTPLEMMATGIPAIVTGWSGFMEYMNEDVGWLLDYKMTPADSFTKEIYKEYCGDWAEPSVDDLVEKMRWCYHNQDIVKMTGDRAAEHVKQNWTWDTKIKTFHSALDKVL